MKTYMEQSMLGKPGTSNFQSLPMPTFVKPEVQDPAVPPPEIPSATIIEIPWVPEPQNWAIESKERSAFENNLHHGLTELFSKFH